MIHQVPPSDLDMDDARQVYRKLRSMRTGRHHFAWWVDSIDRLAIDIVTMNDDTMKDFGFVWSSGGPVAIRLGNVWIRSAAAYAIGPLQCVELSDLLGPGNLKSTPGATAKQILLNTVPDSMFWSDQWDHWGFQGNAEGIETYDHVRSCVGSGFIYADKVRATTKDPSQELLSALWGRLHPEQVTQLELPFHEIDMVSAYRWAMSQPLPFPSSGMELVDFGGLTSEGMTKVEGGILDPAGIVDHRLSKLPRPEKGKLHGFDGWVDNRVLTMLLDEGGKVGKLTKTIRCRKKRPFLSPMMAMLEQTRRSSPHLAPALKLIGNSMFGRMFMGREQNNLVPSSSEKVQKSEEHGTIEKWSSNGWSLISQESFIDRIANPLASASVVAEIKEQCISMMRNLPHGSVLLSADTDGITYSGWTKEDLKLSPGPGEWRLEHDEAVGFIQFGMKQRLLFDEAGTCVKAVLAGVPKHLTDSLVKLGYAKEERVPTLAECVLFGENPGEKKTYEYKLSKEGVDVDTRGGGGRIERARLSGGRLKPGGSTRNKPAAQGSKGSKERAGERERTWDEPDPDFQF